MTLLQMTRGDTALFTATLSYETSGDPVDLTGLGLVFTVKRAARDANVDAVFQKTIGQGITVLNQSVEATKGQATITIDADDTADLENLRTLRWDLQVSAGDEVATPLSGRLAITGDITRNAAGS